MATTNGAEKLGHTVQPSSSPAGDHKHVGDPRQIGGEILRGKVTDAPWTNMGTVPFCGSEPGGSGAVPVLADRTLPAPYPPDKMICPAAQRPPGSSSQWTPSWREMDSNFRFRASSSRLEAEILLLQGAHR